MLISLIQHYKNPVIFIMTVLAFFTGIATYVATGGDGVDFLGMPTVYLFLVIVAWGGLVWLYLRWANRSVWTFKDSKERLDLLSAEVENPTMFTDKQKARLEALNVKWQKTARINIY
ncbi:MAG: hypothetical protein AAF587_29545 [Bacteroidota bacterium]